MSLFGTDLHRVFHWSLNGGMSSTSARAAARVAAMLFVLAGMSGCKFEPGGLSPGEPPADGAPLPDSRPGIDSSVTMDSGTAMDAPLPSDARETPQRRKRIAIDPSRVRAPAGAGALEDFPVLFSVVDPEIADRAGMDGSDIYFVAADGETRLAYEIEKWLPGTGELVAWVMLPEVSATEDTVFFVLYGDPDQAQPVNAEDVWTNGFDAVWHLSQDPGSGETGAITDSRGDHDGTARNMDSSDLVVGHIGDGIDFDGSNDEITFVNSISGNTPHTISAWVSQRTTGSNDAVVVLGTGSPNRARWLYSARNGNTVAFGFYANDLVSGNNIENDGWTLLHWTYDGNTSRLYVNGEQEGPSDASGSVDTQGTDGRIGNVPSAAFGSAMNLNGQADEVRIATAARPQEWIQTEFNNQSNPSTFYAVGPETE
jgi:hypothetical protein